MTGTIASFSDHLAAAEVAQRVAQMLDAKHQPTPSTPSQGSRYIAAVTVTNLNNGDNCPYLGQVIVDDSGAPVALQFQSWTPECEGSGEEKHWTYNLDGTNGWAKFLPT